MSYRVAFYDQDNPQQGHIYPIAHLPNGKRVVVDAVNDTFNHEFPIWQAYDYPAHQAGKAKLSGFQSPRFSWSNLAMGTALVFALELLLSQQQHDEDIQVAWTSNVSAAELAYILYQVPVLVAVHASEMLPE